MSRRWAWSWALSLLVCCCGPAGGNSDQSADPPRVRHITLTGLGELSPGDLRGAMHLKQESWWRLGQRNFFYGTDYLEADLTRLVAHCRAEGFPFAQIENVVVRRLSADWVDIEIAMSEGPRIYIRGAELGPVPPAMRKDLEEEIHLPRGEPLRGRHLLAAEDRLLRICQDEGHALARIERDLHFAGDSVTVLYQIAMGPLVRVGEITTQGYQRTREPVIRREIVLREGDPFRLSKAVRTQERLFDLGLFRSVRITPAYDDSLRTGVSPAEIAVDLAVNVRERKPGWYGFGFGFSSNDRVRLLGEWGYRNLAGRARSLEAEAEIAYTVQEKGLKQQFKRPKMWELQLIYAAPWLLNTPTRWQIRGYYRYERRYDREPWLDEYITGLLLRARWDLTRFRRLIGSIENKWTEGDSTYVTRFISLGLSEDRRDFLLDPTRGHVMQAKAEYAGRFLGGEADFTRMTASYAGYFTLSRGIVWAHRAKVGYVHPVGRSTGVLTPMEKVPFDERFFLGGGTTVRGYPEESLGPQEDGQPQGGQALILLNAEIRFDLFWKLGAALFFDAGNVWADYRQIKWAHWRRGWTASGDSELNVAYASGLGLRLRTPVGPIRLDYGMHMGLGRSGAAEETEWHLSLGQAF